MWRCYCPVNSIATQQIGNLLTRTAQVSLEQDLQAESSYLVYSRYRSCIKPCSFVCLPIQNSHKCMSLPRWTLLNFSVLLRTGVLNVISLMDKKERSTYSVGTIAITTSLPTKMFERCVLAPVILA